MDETKTLAAFVAGASYNDLDNEVIQKAKLVLLDQLGCQFAFAATPWGKAVYGYVKERQNGRKESTVVRYGLKTSAEDTTLANSVFGHGFEMDDTELRTTSHPGVVIIPASLALAEAEKSSGPALISAIVVGYDVLIRTGLATQGMIKRGFHTTGVLGTLGAAAACANLLHLEPEVALSALGIAASDTGGIAEFTQTGGSVKRLHAGFAAQKGMRAALLARLGIGGPPTALEGKRGFCQAFSDEWDLKEITAGLGKEFRILRTGHKAYCCCAAQHAALDATAACASAHGISPGEIEEITVGQVAQEVGVVGTILMPTDITTAQFCGRFGVALRLCKGGNGFRDYSLSNVSDEQILGLTSKVSWVRDEALEKLPPGTAPARVTIKLKNDKTFETTVEHAKGTIENPMTEKELKDKFRDLAGTVLPDERVEEIVRTVDRLDELDDVRKLTVLLSADDRK
jgi:2-methylcitrate dehydratase PrpD